MKPSPSKSRLCRWPAELVGLPALSVRQPWAWLIVNGFKDIENRPRRTRHRGPLLIHAGKNGSDFTPEVAAWINREHGIRIPDELEGGGLVGVVDLVDCVETHPSPWFQPGGFGYVMANPRRLPFVPCKGQLGLFRPEPSDE